MNSAVRKDTFAVQVNEFDKTASIEKSNIASGFLPPHLDTQGGVGYIAETTTALSATGTRSSHYGSIYTKSLATVVVGDANKIAIGSNDPLCVNVNGYKIKLEGNPSRLFPMVVTLPAAPSSSTSVKQHLIILEAWKEEVKIGTSTDALFPYGNVLYEASGTYDGCTLLNTDHTGGNWPLYLSTAPEHGYYVSTNDVNLKTFISNPDNNVGLTSDGKYFQIRYRIATLVVAGTEPGVTYSIGEYPWDGVAYFAPQGKKATRPSSGTKISANGVFAPQVGSTKAGSTILDSGMYLGGLYSGDTTAIAAISTLSLDGFVYAAPVCVIHRRNSTAWSLSNMNGSGAIGGTSGRPDGKFYDHIQKDDILDLRHRVSSDFNMSDLYEENLQQILTSNLATNWEQFKADPDGNGVYDSTNIYGTKLLRAEGVNASAWTAAYQVALIATCNNGISANPDGLRNYYSDVEGEQVLMARIHAENTTTVTPASPAVFAYSSHNLTLDATQLTAYTSGHANRPQWSGRMPDLYWEDAQKTRSGGLNPDYTGNGSKVYATWTSLVGDTIVGVIKQETYMAIYTTVTMTVGIGDGAVYKKVGTSTNVTFNGWNGGTGVGAGYSGYFTGSTPTENFTGTWTKVSGTGDPLVSMGTSRVGMRYHAWNTPNEEYVGEGYDLHSGKAIFINAYLKFTAGSGFLTRVPYDSGDGYGGRSSIKASHWYIGGTQSLPNDGLNFHPFGTAVDPKNLDSAAYSNNSDPHTKSTGMMGFVRRGVVLPIGAEGTYDAVHATVYTVIYDSSVSLYKMWYYGRNVAGVEHILYCTSTDGITWTNFQPCYKFGATNPGLVGAEGTYDTYQVNYPAVIKDGSTYRMWYTGRQLANPNIYRIIYCDSTDGITWTNFNVVVAPSDQGTYDTSRVHQASVIKDGSTYKVWYTGRRTIDGSIQIMYAQNSGDPSVKASYAGSYLKVLGESFNGMTDLDISGAPTVIKDGSIYKIWYTSSYLGNYINYATSIDGKVWSRPICVLSAYTEGFKDPEGVSKMVVIKYDKLYKVWFGVESQGSLYAIFTMMDVNNTGSSTTGVYTVGSETASMINYAVRSTDSVIIFYEARAIQQDWSRFDVNNNIQSYLLKFLAKTAILTNMGTNAVLAANTHLSGYRDFPETIYPQNTYGLTFGDLNILGAQEIGSPDVFRTDKFYNESVDYMISNHDVDTISSTRPKVGDTLYNTGTHSATTTPEGYKTTVDISPLSVGVGQVVFPPFTYEMSAFGLLGAVGERNKELFMPACMDITGGSNARFYRGLAFNFIGRPLVK